MNQRATHRAIVHGPSGHVINEEIVWPKDEPLRLIPPSLSAFSEIIIEPLRKSGTDRPPSSAG